MKFMGEEVNVVVVVIVDAVEMSCYFQAISFVCFVLNRHHFLLSFIVITVSWNGEDISITP